jgi:mobilization protein NikA
MPSRYHPRLPGRPSLPLARRRCFRLLLRLTGAELATVRWRAARARLPAAVYARAAALRSGASPTPVPALNIFLVGQLGRLANILNQLTKLAHQGRTSPVLLPCLEAILWEVRKLRRELIGLDPVGEPARAADGDPGRDAGS